MSKKGLHEPGSTWQNGYLESFNACLCDELLNDEILCSLREAQIIVRGEAPPGRAGETAVAKLTSEPDHSMKAGHCSGQEWEVLFNGSKMVLFRN